MFVPKDVGRALPHPMWLVVSEPLACKAILAHMKMNGCEFDWTLLFIILVLYVDLCFNVAVSSKFFFIWTLCIADLRYILNVFNKFWKFKALIRCQVNTTMRKSALHDFEISCRSQPYAYI